MKSIALTPLTEAWLPAARQLDELVLGRLWNTDGYRREIQSPHSDLLMITLGKANEGEPEYDRLLAIGCLWSVVEEGHITLLVVHPQWQRQGLGQAMLYSLIASAHQRGLEWVTLEVRVSNEPAIALYRRFGFEDVGFRRNYYKDGENALILWRKGLSQPEFNKTLQEWRLQIGDRLVQKGWSHFEAENKQICPSPLDEDPLLPQKSPLGT